MVVEIAKVALQDLWGMVQVEIANRVDLELQVVLVEISNWVDSVDWGLVVAT